MHDRRVCRGSTHASMIIPGAQQTDQFKSTKKSKLTRRTDQYQMRDMRNVGPDMTAPVPGREHIEIQTDQFVEEFTDKPPKYEIGCQSEVVVEEPPPPLLMPVKTGKDFCGQIEDGDLFRFTRDVEPILAVVCGKTLEHARMEVLEEEELRAMREQQAHFEKLRNDEIAEAQKLEAIELRKKQDIERKKA